jgi:hypothetical protein
MTANRSFAEAGGGTELKLQPTRLANPLLVMNPVQPCLALSSHVWFCDMNLSSRPRTSIRVTDELEFFIQKKLSKSKYSACPNMRYLVLDAVGPRAFAHLHLHALIPRPRRRAVEIKHSSRCRNMSHLEGGECSYRRARKWRRRRRFNVGRGRVLVLTIPPLTQTHGR